MRKRKKYTWTVTVEEKTQKLPRTLYAIAYTRQKAERMAILAVADETNGKTSDLTATSEKTPRVLLGEDPHKFDIYLAKKKLL